MQNNLYNQRILMVATVASTLETQFKVYVNALKSEGCDVLIITGTNRPLNFDCRHVSVPFKRDINILYDLITLCFIVFHIIKFRPNVMHSLTPKGGLIGMLASYICGTPIRIHTFTGQVWANKKGFFRGILKFIDKIVAFCATDIYADSHSQRDFLVNEGICKRESVNVINKGSLSGVDLNRFSIDKFSSQDCEALRSSLGIRNKVILYLGRINKDKGIYDLLEASYNLKSLDVTFLLVGPVEPGFDKDKIDACSNVIHLDFSPEPEKYIAISEVLCIPSYREGFGTVVIEAGAMGKAAIGSDIYGLSDAIVNGVTGILFPAGDIQALERALTKFINQDGNLSRLSTNAYERTKKQFDSKIMKSFFIDEYKRLISTRIK